MAFINHALNYRKNYHVDLQLCLSREKFQVHIFYGYVGRLKAPAPVKGLKAVCPRIRAKNRAGGSATAGTAMAVSLRHLLYQYCTGYIHSNKHTLDTPLFN